MDDRSPSTTTPASRPPPPPLNPDELASHRQRRLSFGIPETPAAAETTDDPATQIAGLLRTVAELEKTSRRTQAENERLTAQEAASSSKAAAAEGSSTRAAISELTVKLNTLADLVVALAEKEDRPAPKATTTRTAGGTMVALAPTPNPKLTPTPTPRPPARPPHWQKQGPPASPSSAAQSTTPSPIQTAFLIGTTWMEWTPTTSVSPTKDR